ncbi:MULTISPECIES: SDR family oxidoreductase [Streptomyces]|uniref:SDR family oxidoreductase n=1 Tax=Streptomyces TaxID=1883 RepID=UPI00240D8A28|nr:MULTISPECIES: SDR family oxidoreductase [Streptomyces]
MAADEIRVNCVAPGTIWTDLHADPQRPAKIAALVPWAAPAKPRTAGAVAWLLSDDAFYATGTVMRRIAGGM